MERKEIEKKKEDKGEEYFTRYMLKDGELREIKVSRKEALKDINKILRRDKDFLDIMKRM